MLERDGEVVRCTLAEWIEDGPQIMRGEGPPTRIVLTDRRPASLGDDRRAIWCRATAAFGGGADGHVLPNELYVLLPGKAQHPRGHVFADVAEADAALSAALLAWASRQGEGIR